MKHILLTGATGVLGSQILYELLEAKLFKGEQFQLSVVVRPKEEVTAINRVSELLTPHYMPSKLTSFSQKELLEQIEVISGSIENFEFMPTAPVTVIHAAASVNLNNKPKTRERIKSGNYQATIDLAKRFTTWPHEQFIFVSTAYSCGIQHGQVTDDYLGFNTQKLDFRNAYEEYKYKAEEELAKLAEEDGFVLNIARPSIICGRMIDAPLYVMNRFIVFYLMGKFFKEMSNLFPKSDQQIRIQANKEVSLNIIPVDYVAKAITRLIGNKTINQLNIVNTHAFPVVEVIKGALESNGYTNYSFAAAEPKDKSRLEKIFYSTVALQLVQYVQDNHHSFDTTQLRQLMADIEEPNIAIHYDELLKFAHSRNYDMNATVET